MMQITGDTSESVVLQMLVMVVCVCVCVCVCVLMMMMGASGCLSLSSAISVLKYVGGEKERACVRVTYTHIHCRASAATHRPVCI